MRPLSEATAKIAGRSFQRKYIALGRIVNSWRDIVGESFATLAQPVKIQYRKNAKTDKPDATLHIATNSSQAQKMQYQKGLIMERINQIFGEAWITDIKFVPIVANAPVSKPKKHAPPLTSEQKKTLSDMVVGIEDDEIRNSLLSLGQGILIKEHTKE